jgi:capsule biosynthesis phosphatase
MKNFIVDVDGTLCEELGGVYTYATVPPRIEMINKVNQLYDSGSKIVLFTARGMRTYSGDIEQINLHVRPVLIKWLGEHDVKYHELIMGKPWASDCYYVDDRALHPEEFLKL